MGIVSMVVLVAVGALVAASFGAFAVTSLRERESRASGISAGVALLGVVVLAVGVMAPLGVKEIMVGIAVSGALVLVGALRGARRQS